MHVLLRRRTGAKTSGGSRASVLWRVALAVSLGGVVGCASTGPPSVQLSGTVGYTEDMALPAGALVTIALHEQTSPEHDEVEIARRVIETSEEPPVPFSVSLPGGGIDPDATYTVDAWISAGSRPWFTLEERVPVLTGGHPAEVELLLRRVP